MAPTNPFRLLLYTLYTLLLLAAAPAPGGPPPVTPTTYVALGDSLAFGYTTAPDTPPSLGDQGYVQPFADWLGTQHGGTRPHVVNLAVPGESSQSLFHGGQFGEFLNQNYTHPTGQKQYALLLKTVAAERKAHRTIATVTVQIGANDLMGIITPSFLAESPAEQGRKVRQALRRLAANEDRLLHKLHGALHDTTVIVLGYYNPLEAEPADPRAPAFHTYLPLLNSTLAGEAARFHDRFVDLSAVFAGHEGDWTFITQLGYPNGIHPNASGYAAIATALQQ